MWAVGAGLDLGLSDLIRARAEYLPGDCMTWRQTLACLGDEDVGLGNTRPEICLVCAPFADERAPLHATCNVASIMTAPAGNECCVVRRLHSADALWGWEGGLGTSAGYMGSGGRGSRA